MKKILELIKKLREELEELKNNFETAYMNNTNNINEIKKEESEIKEIEKIIDEKERKQSIILLKKSALLFAFIIITTIIAPPVIKEIIIKTTFMSLMSIFLLTVIPKTEKMLCNFILKLSPKLKKIEDEKNKFKKELSAHKENKKVHEKKQIELKNILNKIEVNMKNKETELRKTEEIYFNNILNMNNTTTTRNKPHKNTVKVRIKKNNIQ